MERSNIPTWTFQYGVMGSYKLSENMIGFLGYAYRKDNVLYSTPEDLMTAFGNTQNGSINIEGHYINVFLDWGF